MSKAMEALAEEIDNVAKYQIFKGTQSIGLVLERWAKTIHEELQGREQLKQAVDEYMDFIRNDYHEDRDDDFSQGVFESAVESFHGKSIWKEVNACIEKACTPPQQSEGT
jgi:hypothetical protein